ncbi:MAG TPA: PAS domain S-box protein [Nitrospirota bacterium]
MTERSKTTKELLQEIEELQARLSEAEETLTAIQRGEVDAIVGPSSDGGRIYTLQGAEQPYRIFFEAMAEGAVTMDLDGTILYCNRAFADLAKVPLEDVTGMPFLDFVVEDSQQDVAALLSNGDPANRTVQVSLKAPGNANVPVAISMNALNTNGVEAVCAIVTDLSDLLLMKQLEQSNRKLSDLNEKLLASREVLFVSEKRLSDSRKAALNLMEDEISSRKKAEQANEELVREINERKQVEQALYLSREDLRRAQEVGNIGSWRLDVRRNVLTWSDENYRIFGIPKGTPLTYETFLAAVHPEDRAGVDARWKAGLRGESYDFEHRIVVDGIVKWVREKAYLEFDRDGALLGGFGIAQDITERKKAEEDLRAAKDELEQRVQERTRDLTRAVDSLHQQIEARALAENELRKSGERLRNTLESITDGFFTLDRKWRFIHVNGETLRLFRKEEAELIGFSLWNIDPLIAETISEARKNAKEQASVTVEIFSTIMDRWVDVRAYPGPDGLTVYFHDITERKEHERRTEVTNALLKLLARKSNRSEYLGAAIDLIRIWSGCRHAGLRIADKSGNIPYESCAGFTPEFLEAESMLSVHRDHCACTRVVSGMPEPQDLPAMTPDGSFFSNNMGQYVAGLTEEQKAKFRGMCVQCGFTSVAVIPVRYGGRVLGAIHFADEREGAVPLKNVEFLEYMAFIIGEVIYRFEIEEERSRLASAVQSVAEGVVVADRRGIVQYANPAFERITGYAREDIVGRDLHVLDSGKQDERFYAGMRGALARDGVWNGQLINRKKDGTLYYEECTMSPIRDAAGEIVNYVSVKRDITEKLRLESIAESVSTMSSIGYVFSGVRHEIGNPINSINAVLSVLKARLDTLSPEAVRENLGKMSDQIARVEYILRSLRTFNLYETQEIQNVKVPAFMESFLPLVRGDFATKGIDIDVEVSPDAEWMRVDPRALQQVLLNLLANAADAVSGRESPRISLRISRDSGKIRLQVRDNGHGIPAEHLQNIFKPFYTTKEHGTGLGLVIVRKMLTRMNASIDIQSAKDLGTVVNIVIPEGTHEGR